MAIHSQLVICGRIREMREVRGWPQEMVAYYLGVTQATYSRIETGEVELTITKLEGICAVYGITLAELVSGL